MKRITPEEFQSLVEQCPGWALTLTEPVQVTGFCCMNESPITHLSTYLHFEGMDQFGKSAEFIACENLRIAEGIFSGEVGFAYSSVEKIGDLTILNTGKSGNAADFTSCKKLRVATGKYPGAVTFKGSAVKRTENLIVQKSNKEGLAAEFYSCKSLRHAEGHFPGHVCYHESGIHRIGQLNASSADFSACEELFDASSPAKWLDSPHVTMDPETRSRLEAIRNL